MSRSHNTLQFVDAIIKAADRLDPVLVNEFMNFSIEAAEAHYEIIKPTISEYRDVRQQRIINTGYILLTLFNCLRLSETQDYQ